MNNFTEQLNWDSAFFNKKIAKIVVNDPDEKYVDEKLSEYKNQGFDLVYVFLSGDTVLPESLHASYQCELVDRKVIYSTILQEVHKIPPYITEYTGEPSALYSLALQSGGNSRYRTDRNFKTEEFERLYQTWMDNSINHLIADKVFVFNSEQGIEGFITVSIRPEEASIGLIATNEEKRNLGIGSLLISAAKKYASDSQATSLSVATQKDNIRACSFYEKNGFSIKSETNIYHAWLMK